MGVIPAAERAAIRARHVNYAVGSGCQGCAEEWPCDASRLLDALDAAERNFQDIYKAQEEGRRAAEADLAALETRLDALLRYWREQPKEYRRTAVADELSAVMRGWNPDDGPDLERVLGTEEGEG